MPCSVVNARPCEEHAQATDPLLLSVIQGEEMSTSCWAITHVNEPTNLHPQNIANPPIRPEMALTGKTTYHALGS